MEPAFYLCREKGERGAEKTTLGCWGAQIPVLEAQDRAERPGLVSGTATDPETQPRGAEVCAREKPLNKRGLWMGLILAGGCLCPFPPFPFPPFPFPPFSTLLSGRKLSKGMRKGLGSSWRMRGA